jgi:ATP-binding cassette subfamily B protein
MVEFKWIWQYVKKHRFFMFGGLSLVVAASLLSMVNPFVQKIIVDKVIQEKRTELMLSLALIMIGVTLVRAVIRYVFQMSFEHVSQKVIYDIREDIYIRLQALDFEFFDKTKTGDIMSRMTGDLEAVRHFTAWVFFQTCLNLLTFITAIAIMFSINSVFTLILLAVTPFIAFFTYRLSGKVKPAFSAIREQFARLNSVVQENISGNRVVKAFAQEGYEIEKFLNENGGFRDRNLAAARIWEKYLPVLDSMAGVLSVVVILFGGIMVIKQSLTLGELVAFNSYIWAINGPMRMSGWLINDIQRFVASAEKIIALLKREPRISSPESSIKTDKIKGEIEFKHVDFCYGDGEVLKDISFKVSTGQTIAIIGPTGSGKSTLVSLICRFYDCTGGEILIDGANIKDYDLRTIRENVSVAMQDIFLFSDTIEGNISYGVPDAHAETVEWAADTAMAHNFIVEFSEGYDTIIGERGVGLSGGQRQRIALARALLKNPSVLILDDTTSSVDIETEHEIQKRLREFSMDRTTFIIAHRISSVKNADNILVLNDGMVIEHGRHEELLSKKGYYYSVFVNQYGDFDMSMSESAG